MEETYDRGIPVVLASTGVNTDKYTTWVSRNNTKAGYLYADWMGKKLDGKGKVVALMGIAGSSYAEDVLRGVKQGLSKYPGIELVDTAVLRLVAGEGEVHDGSLHPVPPVIDGILADGGQMALGAVEALLDAGEEDPARSRRMTGTAGCA